ncbi:MAG: DUF1343 domain-containing protein [Rhabdochlamydiaceae bacterium]|nr:DUF1343 domain-containing protein [Candidatus Amphrikana amoebophyrae]
MIRFLLISLLTSLSLYSVELGIDNFLSHPIMKEIQGKKVGLITNQTGVDSKLKSTIEILTENDKINLVSLFCPEHGLKGTFYAGEKVESDSKKVIPLYSLHGATRRPTKAMLEGLDFLIYDIQDGGVRTYTYASTLYYVMEEAAKYNIKVVVLDRPNPISGEIVDGPMLDEKKWRSFIGYINVPYCHGMTIGELATLFNSQYCINCPLEVIKMKGYQRNMSFDQTGLPWIPASPNVPESNSPLFMATTGMIGELGIVNIGIGYTLPFKVVGAPWIDSEKFADHLNKQNLKGVRFLPYTFRPFFGSYKGKDCHGVLIKVTHLPSYKPLEVSFLLMGSLKSLYPKQVNNQIKNASQTQRDLFCKAAGNSSILKTLQDEKICAWKLIELCRTQSNSFLKTRSQYLFKEYEPH